MMPPPISISLFSKAAHSVIPMPAMFQKVQGFLVHSHVEEYESRSPISLGHGHALDLFPGADPF